MTIIEQIKSKTGIFYPCRQNTTRRMSSFGNLGEWLNILERFDLNIVTTIDMLCIFWSFSLYNDFFDS
jgi:hypothetical protein